MSEPGQVLQTMCPSCGDFKTSAYHNSNCVAPLATKKRPAPAARVKATKPKAAALAKAAPRTSPKKQPPTASKPKTASPKATKPKAPASSRKAVAAAPASRTPKTTKVTKQSKASPKPKKATAAKAKPKVSPKKAKKTPKKAPKRSAPAKKKADAKAGKAAGTASRPSASPAPTAPAQVIPAPPPLPAIAKGISGANLGRYTAEELIAFLKEKGVKCSGTKPVLVRRVQQFLSLPNKAAIKNSSLVKKKRKLAFNPFRGTKAPKLSA